MIDHQWRARREKMSEEAIEANFKAFLQGLFPDEPEEEKGMYSGAEGAFQYSKFTQKLAEQENNNIAKELKCLEKLIASKEVLVEGKKNKRVNFIDLGTGDGTKAIKITSSIFRFWFVFKICASGFLAIISFIACLVSVKINNNSFFKNTMTASIVAKWSKISKLSNGSSKPKITWKNTKCPELDTGKNSVNPWVNAKNIYFKMFILFRL